MSSSPQSARPMTEVRSQRSVRFASLPCPVCGRRTLADVVEDCELSGGRFVKRLRHTRCKSCGTTLVSRVGYRVGVKDLEGSRCGKCGTPADIRID